MTSPTSPITARVEPGDLDRGFAVVDPSFAAKLETDHTRTFEVSLRTTVAGQESFSRDIPNVGEEALSVLDERGIVRVGAQVEPGVLLVGRVGPRAGYPLTPEDKLLRAIFGDAAGTTKDVSLRTPAGCFGEVCEVRADETKVVVVVGWRRPLDVGDVLQIDEEPVVVAAIRTLDEDLAWDVGVEQAQVAKVQVARDTMIARSIGPYAPNEQPTADRDSQGGQPITLPQMEILSAHAPWALLELCTVKSDSVSDRSRAYESLVKGENPDLLPTSGRSGGKEPFSFFEGPRIAEGEVFNLAPEAFKTLALLLRALGLSVNFNEERISVQTLDADGIRALSHGELGRALLHENGQPAIGGLLCPKIFGPVEDYRCACGKHTRMKDRGVVCEKCGVEVITSSVRRERIGHITLKTPCLQPLLQTELEVIPVLPPDLRTAQNQALNDRYTQILSQNGTTNLQGAVDELVQTLVELIDTHWSETVCRKTEDYSGIAHLTVDPALELEPEHCNLPRTMALELFKPFIYGILEEQGYVTTIKSAKRMVERHAPEAMRALEEAALGYPVLLVADNRMICRKVEIWDAPAIAVDEDTARDLASQRVMIHVPITHQAAYELTQLEDRPAAPLHSASGWLSQAMFQERFSEEVLRAASSGDEDSIEDPLLARLLGRPPEPLDEATMEAWRSAEQERRAARRPPPPVEEEKPTNPQLERSVDELDLSVVSANALANANIITLADLCQRTESELLKTKGFGRKSLKEVKEILMALDLHLGMRI